jgi:uncharacterized protein YndB with AHSA1/START domain
VTERRGRAVTREITIAAPVSAVWKALADGEELTRWFPQLARVQPGAGGRMWRAWPAGEEIEERIERWEPNVHLRSVGLTGAWKGIVTDYLLTGQGGTTTLRVVSSGFGDDADWDALYEAFGGGWDFELRGLRHYLERHAGTPRIVACARGPRAVPAAEGWSRIAGPAGWFGLSDLGPEPGPGARYQARLTTGERLSGVVVLWQPPRQFAATVEQLNNAYLRIDTGCTGDVGTPLVWLSTYGLTPQAVQGIEHEWQVALGAVFSNQPV